MALRKRDRNTNTFRMNIMISYKDRETLEELAEITGYSLSATIGMAIEELALRLESGDFDND